jgi:hypothetical protein
VSLLANAADGLMGAVVAGAVSVAIFWRQSRASRGPLRDAWRDQANELADRLAAQYQAEIRYLRTQLTASRAETSRVQKLLAREQRRGPDD